MGNQLCNEVSTTDNEEVVAHEDIVRLKPAGSSSSIADDSSFPQISRADTPSSLSSIAVAESASPPATASSMVFVDAEEKGQQQQEEEPADTPTLLAPARPSSGGTRVKQVTKEVGVEAVAVAETTTLNAEGLHDDSTTAPQAALSTVRSVAAVVDTDPSRIGADSDADVEIKNFKYTAPDGKGFQNRTEYRKYLFANFYSFTERNGEFLCKTGGDIDGQAFNLSRLTDCEVQLLDHSDQVLADYLQGCRVFIGPSAGSVFLRNCENCSITVAAKQLRTRDCKNCRFYVYSKTEPVIEMTEDIEVRRFNGSYDGMEMHFRAANLDMAVNNWSNIHDFSKRDKDLGPEPHYTLIKSAPTPWNATGERATARPRLTSETSLSMC